jgi:hypothetical protein
MKTLASYIGLAALLALTSCSKPEQTSIVGRWHEIGTTGLAAFHEDGTVEITDGQAEVSGRYSFISQSKLKLDLSGKGAVLGPRVYDLVFADDNAKMLWTDVDGKKSQYLKDK